MASIAADRRMPPPKQVRVWAASDLHGIDPATLPVQPDGCDIALLAGDLCPLPDWAIRTIDAQVVWLNVVVGEWVASRPQTQFVAIPGNRDVFLKRKHARKFIRLPPNVHFLIDEGVDVCGLRVYGTPWVPSFNGRFAFEAHSEAIEQQWFDSIPAGTDILVSHAPPRIAGLYLDSHLQYPHMMLRHFGSRPLADAIRRVAPALCVFGHIHTGDHSLHTLSCGTALRNVSVIDEDYRLAFRPAVINVPVLHRTVPTATHPLS